MLTKRNILLSMLASGVFLTLHMTARADEPVVQIQNKSKEAIEVSIMNLEDRVNNFDPKSDLPDIKTETLNIDPDKSASSKTLGLTRSSRLLLKVIAGNVEVTCSFLGAALKTKFLTWDPSKPKPLPWLYPQTGTKGGITYTSQSGHSLWHNVTQADFTCYRMD